MKINVGTFVRQQFDKDFAGTKILDRLPERFEDEANERISSGTFVLVDGYAPFCKHAFLRNWTNARQGEMVITEVNVRFLRSGYKARTPEELPVLERWWRGLKPPELSGSTSSFTRASNARWRGSRFPRVTTGWSWPFSGWSGQKSLP
jgi:hypothetical protein